MNNYWLNKKSDPFHDLVVEYQTRKREGTLDQSDIECHLIDAFTRLILQIVESYPPSVLSGHDVMELLQEGMMTAFDHIDRFDPEKCRAFNLFSTCIFGRLRQIGTRQK